MKSFKHIISYACDKNCSYCINEILVHNEKQNKEIPEIALKYGELSGKGYDHILISGGEPVLNKMFLPCLIMANNIFKQVSIITAHISALSNKNIEKYADDILYSFHVGYLSNFENNVVNINIPVYASMVVETYNELQNYYLMNTPHLLKNMGYSGLTLREKYPDGLDLPESINVPDDFSMRTYKRNNCVKDSLILLPDLSITNQCDFS